MKIKHQFDRKSVEKELFSTYKTGELRGRRTRTFLRSMARYVEHGFEIGYKDAVAGKPMIQPNELSELTDNSPLMRGIMRRTYDAYRLGFEAGKKEA